MTDQHLMIIGYLQSIIEGLQSGEIDNFQADIRLGGVQTIEATRAEERWIFDGSFAMTMAGVKRQVRDEFAQFQEEHPDTLVDQGVWRIADKHAQRAGVLANRTSIRECGVITLGVK